MVSKKQDPLDNEAQASPMKFDNTVSRSALLENGSDHRFRKLLYDLDHLSSLLSNARGRIAAEIDLTSPQYNILMLIAQKQEDIGVSVSRVARLLHVSGPFVTSQSNILVKKGLVEKVPNPEDGRSILLRLTQEGYESIQHLTPSLRDFNDKVFDNLTKKQFVSMLESVDALIENWHDAERYLPRLNKRER